MTIGREKLTEQVIKLLKRYSAKSESAIAIAIDGEWGVGKSYMYRKDLALEIEKNPNIKKKPIYTSVFGKKDENEIIQDLVAQFLKTNNKKTEIIEGVTKNIFGLFGQNLDLGFFFKMIQKEDLQNSIICIDDFERLSSKIPIEDVLGLISELKENKGCHIILLCNENMISENHKEKFKEYREKIIDRTFQYKPTPTEQFDLVKTLLWGYSENDQKEIGKEAMQKILGIHRSDDGVLKLNSINLREIKKVIHCFNDYCDGLENNQMLEDAQTTQMTHILFTNIVLWFLFCYTKVRPLERELERLVIEKDKLEKKREHFEKTNEPFLSAVHNKIQELGKNIDWKQSNINFLRKQKDDEIKKLGYTESQIPFLTLITNFLPSLFKEYDENNVFTFRNDQKKYQTYLSNEETFISILSEIARQYRFQKEYNALSANKQNNALEASKDFFNQHGSSSSVWFMLGYRPQNWNPKFFSEKPFESSLIGNNPQYREKIQELVQEAFNKVKYQNNHWLNRDQYKREIEAFLKKKGIESQ